MATVHTDLGDGEIVASETTRGRTHYKVALRGGDAIWMDETEVGLRTGGADVVASNPRARAHDTWASGRDRGVAEHGRHDLDDFGDELGGALSGEFENPGYNHHAPGYDPTRDYEAWEDGTNGKFEDGTHGEFEHEAAKGFDFEPTGHTFDNDADLPYNPYDGQFPVDAFRQDSTQSPDHEIDRKERLRPTKSHSGEPAAKRPYPGPNPDLFAKSAGFFDEGPQMGAYPNKARADEGPFLSDPEAPMGGHDMGAPTPHQTGPHGLGRDDPEVSEYAHPSLRHDDDEYGGMDPDVYERSMFGIPAQEHPHHMGGYEPAVTNYTRDHPARDRYEAEEEGPHRHEDMWSPEEIQQLKYRPAGLSDKYIRIADVVDRSQAGQFRNDPQGTIERTGSFDLDAGLDHETGAWMDTVVADGFKGMIFTSAWKDVSAKARRLRREGRVQVEDISPDRIYAKVTGDHGVYDTMIAKGGDYGQVGQGISNWRCSCDWGKWAFKRQFTFVGRLCSHGYAAYQEMQSHHIKGDANHPFNKRRKLKASADASEGGSLSDFKSWIKDENGDHIDLDAADRYVATRDDPMDKDEAQKVYDYAMGNVSERPERDYDQDGYSLDNADHYKTADLLRHEPHKMSPDLVSVPHHEGEDAHYFTDLGDDRETTGPDQIMAAWYRDAKSPEHHPNFAWHDDETEDFPESGIVHFSQRRASLVYLAEEDLLNKMRDLSQEPPEENFGRMQDHNEEVSELADELHDRGMDAGPIVAMVQRSMWRRAEVDAEGNDVGKGEGVPPQSNAVAPPPPGPTQAEAVSAYTGTPAPGGGAPAPQAAPADGPANNGAGRPGMDNGPHGAPGTPMNPVTTADGGPRDPASPKPGAGSAQGANGGGGFGGGSDYTVKPGDTLSGIAQSKGGDLSALEKANAGPMASGTNIGQNADLIHPGDVLKGVGGSSAPSASSAGWGMGSETGPKAVAAPSNGGIGEGAGAKPGVVTPSAAPAAGTDNGPHGAPGSSMNPTNATPGSSVSGAGGGLFGGGASGPKPGAIPPPAAGTGIHAQRFAERYFQADDGLDINGDDKKTKMPGAAPPVGQGINYKPTAPSGGGPELGSPGTPGGKAPAVPIGDNGVSSSSSKGNGPTGNWVTGPNGPVDTSGHGGDQATAQQSANGGGGQDSAPASGGPLKTNPLGGGSGGGIMDQIGPIAGGIANGIGGMIPGLSGIMNEVGPLVSGLGHMFGSTDAERYAMRYFEADGSFLGEGGQDQADYPFAGSGPNRQPYSTSSQDYIDEHEKGNRDETWVTDNEGDITTYTKDRPRQRPKQGGRQVTPHNAFAMTYTADAYNPGEQGYFNPANRPYQEDDSDQYAPENHKSQGELGGKGGGMFGDALGGGEAAGAGELAEVAPLLLAANSHFAMDDNDPAFMDERQVLASKGGSDDANDIVRQFQASQAAAGLMSGGNSSSSGSYSDDAIAANARKFLQKTAGRNYSMAEQRELEDESHPQGARNLGGLDLRGTHYE